MFRIGRTARPVPSWLMTISPPEAKGRVVFGSPTILVRKSNGVHGWSATRFGLKASIYIHHAEGQVTIYQPSGVYHYHPTFWQFLRAVFERATQAAKQGEQQ